MRCEDEFDTALAASQAVEAHFEAVPIQDGDRFVSVDWYQRWRELEDARDLAMAAFRICAEASHDSQQQGGG